MTRVKIIISDTHIGAGGARQGNKLEDFTSDDVFFSWVHELIDESNVEGKEMTLIINGDWIEFLQVPEVKTFDPSLIYPVEAYTNLTAEAALARLEVVHAGHPLVFQALADFLSPGPPRRSLVILFGNHDPELAYPQVQERLRMLLGARGRKRDLVSVGERSYFEDGVYVEHGNAYTEKINQFSNPDHPFDPDHPELIERPPGSYVVTDFYNQVERDQPWIDGVHPMSSLVFYALAYDPAFAMRVIKELVVNLPHMVNDMLVTGASESAEADLLAELDAMEEDELLQKLAEDEEFQRMFNQQLARAMMQKGLMPEPHYPDLATGSLLSFVPPEKQAQEIAEQYWSLLEKAAVQIAHKKRARVVAFGHIHERIERILPSGAVYLNTGTWIWKANFKNSPEEVWRDLIAHPEKYMHQRYLTYARVDIADNGRITSARLLMANELPAPPAPPQPMPPASIWARLILKIRDIVAKLTGWL